MGMNLTDTAIACPACHREWQDHPGIMHTCRLATDLAETLRGVLEYARPPECTRDFSRQDMYFDLVERARMLIVKARTFESEL